MKGQRVLLRVVRTGWIAVMALALLLLSLGGTVAGAEGAAGRAQVAGVSDEAKRKQAEKEHTMYANAELADQVIAQQWTLIPSTASIGDVVLVRSDKQGKVTWQGKTYELQPFGVGYYTYLPINRQVKPGKYKVGGETLNVLDKKFKTQYLKVSKKTVEMRLNTKRIKADQKKIDKARSQSKPEFLFTSSFIEPVQGRLSTAYGQTRYVNGKFDKSHMAIDIAAKSGTPVKATNDGIVVLADSLYLSGNSIYVDHGLELFSQYIHLSKIFVKPGQKVKRGQVIGAVGSTGFSTGPHLHFAFWAHNIQVNPYLFFGTSPFKWIKA
jgi:biotin carboxyl carrier protein